MRAKNFAAAAVVMMVLFSVPGRPTAQEKAVSPEARAQLARGYSQQEIESVEKLINSAAARGLPKSYFSARLSEAAAKRIKFEVLYRVLEKKIIYLEKGQGIVAVLEKNGHRAAKPDEDIMLSAELVERGMDAGEIIGISDRTGKAAPVEEILSRADISARLKEAGYRGDKHKEIAGMLFSMDLDTAERLAELLAEYPSASAYGIIKKGVEEKRKLGWFRDKLAEEKRKEQVKEVIEDKRPER